MLAGGNGRWRPRREKELVTTTSLRGFLMLKRPVCVMRTKRETEICQAPGTSLDSNCQPRCLKEIVAVLDAALGRTIPYMARSTYATRWTWIP
jgi:hypothetical protein